MVWVSLVEVSRVDLGLVKPALYVAGVDLWRRHSLARVVATTLGAVPAGLLVFEVPRHDSGLAAFCQSLAQRVAAGWRVSVVRV
jgi:hypothetical protein